MFDGGDSFGGYNPMGGQGVGWTGIPGVTTTEAGTTSAMPWMMEDGSDAGGAPGPGMVSGVTQATTQTIAKLGAWPLAHQTLFFGGVLLIVVGWYLHHKAILE